MIIPGHRSSALGLIKLDYKRTKTPRGVTFTSIPRTRSGHLSLLIRPQKRQNTWGPIYRNIAKYISLGVLYLVVYPRKETRVRGHTQETIKG